MSYTTWSWTYTSPHLSSGGWSPSPGLWMDDDEVDEGFQEEEDDPTQAPVDTALLRPQPEDCPLRLPPSTDHPRQTSTPGRAHIPTQDPCTPINKHSGGIPNISKYFHSFICCGSYLCAIYAFSHVNGHLFKYFFYFSAHIK